MTIRHLRRLDLRLPTHGSNTLGKALCALGVVAATWGCDATQAPGLATVEGASHIALRCVNEGPDGGLVGLPLDGCGCSVLEPGEAGLAEVRHLGRVECSCEVLNGTSLQDVEYVATDPANCVAVMGTDGCQTGWSCLPSRGDDGDWLPSGPPVDIKVAGAAGCPSVVERPVAVDCAAQGGGQVRAYVASAQNGRVSVLDLTAGDPTDADKEPKRVLDVDATVPGVTTLPVHRELQQRQALDFLRRTRGPAPPRRGGSGRRTAA
jgi:hypothetical protein